MMIKRDMESAVREAIKGFPAVTITGPRQSGKTTLTKMLFPEYKYLNLENPETRAQAQEDPRSIFIGMDQGIILDEIQRCPELLSWAQTFLDDTGLIGKLILTGSNQFEYLKDISQSLAGRTAIFKLLPFSFAEIDVSRDLNWEDYAVQGFYPRLYDRDIEPGLFYPSYTNTYLERDIRALVKVSNLATFERFISLCAGRTGSVLNINSLSVDCGVDFKTAQAWLSLLQASFIVYLLKPYHANINKRLIKSPKLYFFDTGLLCSLLGIRNSADLAQHPLRGEIFETMVVGEFVKHYYNRGLNLPLTYFRDSQGHEVDLMIQTGASFIPVEIESGSTIQPAYWRNLSYLHKLSIVQPRAGIIFADRRSEERNNTMIMGWDRIDIDALTGAQKL